MLLHTYSSTDNIFIYTVPPIPFYKCISCYKSECCCFFQFWTMFLYVLIVCSTSIENRYNLNICKIKGTFTSVLSCCHGNLLIKHCRHIYSNLKNLNFRKKVKG
ncbi:hypothetical protein GDO81_001466 [Engystomops pustulosus]|uniref:Uncharacterized protein n=1 Tax=Engystomops pustulosus TaxID=76066 RepID=A0AAV7DER9_ENGPU|nr:hypothetical protein GDO81_001466 [Engystomops pustulosus]